MKPKPPRTTQPDATSAPTSARRQRALELLAGGASDAVTARALDVDRATVWRWRQEPAFAAALQAMGDERVALARQRRASLSRAMELLEEAARRSEAVTTAEGSV